MNPWNQFRILAANSFSQYIEPEPDDASDHGRQPMMPFIAGMVAVPGAFFCMYEITRYLDIRNNLRLAAQQAPTIEAKFFLITYTMVSVGLFLAWRWETLFVDEQDYLVLGALPVSPGTMFAAKFGGLLAAVSGVAVAANLVSLLVYPGMAAVGGVSAVREYLVHPFVLVLSVAFVLAVFVAAQSVLLLVVPYGTARKLTPLIQAVALGAMMFMGVCAFDSSALVADFQHHGAGWLVWMPSFWFVGLYQVLLGQSDPLWYSLSVNARQALTGAVALAGTTLLLTYARHLRQIMEAKPSRTPARSGALLQATARVCTRTPGQRAGYDFFLQTLSRNQRHRLVIAMMFAFALSLSLRGGTGGVAGLPSEAQATIDTLSMPLIVSFFLIAALLWANAIPLGSRPAWIFELAAGARYNEVMDGARRALSVASTAAPLLLSVVFYGWRFEAALAGRYLLMTALLLLLAAAVAGRNIRQIPFSADVKRFPPAQSAVVLVGASLLFLLYAYGMARLQMWAAHSIGRTAGVSSVLACVLVGLKIWPIEVLPPDTSKWLRQEGLLLPELDSW